MTRKCYPTLVKAAENITNNEMCVAPELPTLAALDAALLATARMLKFHYPSPGAPLCAHRDIADGVEEHIVDSIYILTTALRSSLSAYYAAIQKSCDDSLYKPPQQTHIPF